MDNHKLIDIKAHIIHHKVEGVMLVYLLIKLKQKLKEKLVLIKELDLLQSLSKSRFNFI